MKQYEKEHLALVLENAAECCVLLKTNGDFPISGPTKIDAYGSGVRYTVKGGTGSGEVNSKVTYTIEEGLEKEGFTISSKKWLDAYDQIRTKAKKEFYKELKREAKEKHENAFLSSMGKVMLEPVHELEIEKRSNLAIYVLSRNSGEGNDRKMVEGDVKLSKSEVRDILVLEKSYEKFMLVLNVGGVVDLSPVAEVSNILLLSQLGVDCGKVLADILTGKQNPSGKLTTSWAASEDYCKEGSFGDWNDNRYNEGIYVGYRYFDTIGKKALFPFGYGLSYTKFSMECLDVQANGASVSVKVKVKNIGNYPGKEVVQCYLSMPVGKLDKAYQDLVAFAKSSFLKVGQEEELELSFQLTDFASYEQEETVYLLEQGDYLLRIGDSSVDTSLVASLSLDETVEVRRVKNCLGTPDFKDIKLEAKREELPADIKRIPIFAKEIQREIVSYEHEDEIDERVKTLTDEELAYLVIGGFDPNAKGLSIIGNASRLVAGAAGETTAQLKKKGIQPLVMADGPAGLRLCRSYYRDEKGAHDASGSGMVPESITEMMGPVTRLIANLLTGKEKVPKNAIVKEQSCTMIPIGTAIAQSFNLELAKRFGDLVGEEMELFGVHLWLAPALNIHRSILCGRNFEYYSEDPLLSGLMAAAITEGVQSHKHCGTTIKHFAANNAETNRYCNNSQVSERAMREIYLRGFEICVRKSRPHALMTSYNLLNGTHTSEHAGLIEDILRREFGFEGIVMTDWVMELMTSKHSIYRNALSNEVVKAGGDLFMPGLKADYERVLKALKDGSLSRKQVEINGSRVIRMTEKLI